MLDNKHEICVCMIVPDDNGLLISNFKNFIAIMRGKRNSLIITLNQNFVNFIMWYNVMY